MILMIDTAGFLIGKINEEYSWGQTDSNIKIERLDITIKIKYGYFVNLEKVAITFNKLNFEILREYGSWRRYLLYSILISGFLCNPLKGFLECSLMPGY